MLAPMALPSTPPQNSGLIDIQRPRLTQTSPSFSDDSALELPDFPYFTNSQGEFVRVKTPSPDHVRVKTPSPDHLPSPLLGPRRASLSRSESAPSIVEPPPILPPSTSTVRQFTRVQSGPVPSSSTPATTSTYYARSAGLSSTQRKLTGAARRVVRVEEPEADREPPKENGDALPFPSSSTNTRPLTESVVPQRTVTANGRQVIPVPSRFGSRMKMVEPIAEVDSGMCSMALLSRR